MRRRPGPGHDAEHHVRTCHHDPSCSRRATNAAAVQVFGSQAQVAVPVRGLLTAQVSPDQKSLWPLLWMLPNADAADAIAAEIEIDRYIRFQNSGNRPAPRR